MKICQVICINVTDCVALTTMVKSHRHLVTRPKKIHEEHSSMDEKKGLCKWLENAIGMLKGAHLRVWNMRENETLYF